MKDSTLQNHNCTKLSDIIVHQLLTLTCRREYWSPLQKKVHLKDIFRKVVEEQNLGSAWSGLRTITVLQHLCQTWEEVWGGALTRVKGGTRTEPMKSRGSLCERRAEQRGGGVSAIWYLFLTVSFGCHTRSLEDLNKGGGWKEECSYRKILSLFASVISRLWWFSSTKLQQHRKHEHKSAQTTQNALASMEGLKE